MRTCPLCKQEDSIEIMVDVTMIIPARMENQISKTNLRSKDVKIYAANWPRASYICKTAGCNYVHTWKIPESYKNLLTETES